MAPPQHDPQVAVSIDRCDFRFGTIYSGELTPLPDSPDSR